MTFRTERKIKLSSRKCDGGGGVPGTDAVAIVSVPEEKMYRVSLHKRRRLDNLASVHFGYAKDGQSCSTSLSMS